ncbi:capsid assembly protein [Dialister micraerophilus]|uniref:Phage T7 capsid assembly protein n=1 Tax=Dialister micraerophilus UPII 345-E TaxID=910314 RepID=E4LA98_9FIRM|nr:phage capsid protein [Dialister micraerophilus]EFR42269.1 phage T7 capsid assembly protein [Dialister micraerophilus UPII 345-E]
MDETSNNNNEVYGKNAVTGNIDDVVSDVEITTSDTQKINMKDTNTSDTQEPKQVQEKQQEEEKQPQKINQEQIQQAEDALVKDLTDKGIDVYKMSGEYERTGKLSEDDYIELAKAGYPRSLVDTYIAGLEASAGAYVESVYGVAGGQENYERICNHVRSLGDNAIDAFNNAIEQGNINQLAIMFRGYQSQMDSTYGTRNRTLMGQGSVGNQGGKGGYTSKEEMIKAISDPKYSRDKAYTKEVEQKIMHSNFIG